MAQYFRAGGFATSTRSDIKFLHASCNVQNDVSAFKVNGTDYQVTSGKTFYVCKLVILQAVAAAEADCFKLGYADNSLGWNAAYGSLTNPVAVIGLFSGTGSDGICLDGAAASTSGIGVLNDSLKDINFAFGPSQKYMYYRYTGTQASTILLHGYEA